MDSSSSSVSQHVVGPCIRATDHFIGNVAAWPNPSAVTYPPVSPAPSPYWPHHMSEYYPHHFANASAWSPFLLPTYDFQQQLQQYDYRYRLGQPVDTMSYPQSDPANQPYLHQPYPQKAQDSDNGLKLLTSDLQCKNCLRHFAAPYTLQKHDCFETSKGDGATSTRQEDATINLSVSTRKFLMLFLIKMKRSVVSITFVNFLGIGTETKIEHYHLQVANASHSSGFLSDVAAPFAEFGEGRNIRCD